MKKSQKSRLSFSAENQNIHKGIIALPKKTGQNDDGGRLSNFYLKLNVHVQTNMLTAIWLFPSPNLPEN